MNNAIVGNKKQITIGLDLGDRRHTYCVLDETGKIAKEGTLGNTREQLATMAGNYPDANVVKEAGTHSPWVSRFLQELGLRVIVANPRKTRAIYENERKSDRRDAGSIRRFVCRAGLFFFIPLRLCQGAVAPPAVPPEPRGYGGA